MTRIELPLTEKQAQACAAYALTAGCETWRVAVSALTFRDRINERTPTPNNQSR